MIFEHPASKMIMNARQTRLQTKLDLTLALRCVCQHVERMTSKSAWTNQGTRTALQNSYI
jgi:hypothetical protein